MVVSRINDTLSYPETRSIMPSDKNLEVELYSIFVKGVEIVAAIGKAKHTYKNKNIVYYPIYMIKNTSKAMQIGIYEISSDKVLSLTNQDNEFAIESIGQPLIYTFATKKIIMENRMIPPSESVENNEKEQPDQEPESDLTTTSSIPALRADIFTFDASTISSNRSISNTFEESQKDAENIIAKFKKPPSGHTAAWLQTIMKNNHYETHENDGKNDSLFMTIRDAFLQIGQSTTVLKLREKLSLEVTQELLDTYIEHFHLSSETLLVETKRTKILHTEYEKHEKTIRATLSASEQKSLIVSAKRIAEQHRESLTKAKVAREMLNEIKFMKGVTTIEALRKKIQSSEYPADAWAIATLERILNIKLIVISSDYVKKDANNMIHCGNIIDPITKSRGSFMPEFYIMTECTADMHYRLISYKGKRIFVYAEIPYDIKQLVITKCVERNSGIFTLIPEFRQLTQGRIGNAGNGDSGDDIDKDVIDTLDVDILASVDPHIVFQFYIDSADKTAGKGSGEKITHISRKLDFAELNPKGLFPNWRRKLDNAWLHSDTPILIDGHQWNSVEHYVQAGKFKNENPNFYINFSAGKNTKISNDVAIALEAGNTDINTQHRPSTVSIDSTYTDKQENDDTIAAINAKFTQIPHFNQLLIATKNAMMYQYMPGKKPKIATDLILIRNKIA
jgi:hypothetical protein